MGDDEEAARQTRAEELRRTIERMRGSGASRPARSHVPAPRDPGKPETPAEFVRRRLREIDEGAKT